MDTPHLIDIANDCLSVSCNLTGGELWSLKDADGAEYMTDADPAFWSGHAPLLFPFVGRLKGDSYRLGGEPYFLPQHGFARRRVFGLAEREATRVLFRLEADAASREVYPFEFALDMEYALNEATLQMAATVHNMGTGPMPFSFGYHPAFAWPLPGGGDKNGHAIEFDAPETAPLRRISADFPGLIQDDTVPSPVDGRRLALDHTLFANDALIWDRLESRGLTYASPDGPSLRFDFPDTPWLGIWQKPGANFICIEPWAGMADPVGHDGDFTKKPGIMMLEPGQRRSFRMDVGIIRR